MKTVKPTTTHEVSTPEALKVIERAGRTCYKSEDRITDESSEKFVQMIIKRGHDSVLEHASVTFRFITDRAISLEMVRHRLASFSQESTRYVNYGGDDIGFIEPPMKNQHSFNFWKDACRSAESKYHEMINNGESPQIARSVLPNCLKTEIVVSANFREWRHILKLRLAKAAHPQIREAMLPVYHWFQENYPVIVADIAPFDLEETSNA